MNRAVVIAGVTGIGKSDVALQLCKSLNGEIIVADSIQIRSHMSIGANRPTTAECATVPHHMLDHISPMAEFSAGDYVRAVQPIVSDILRRDKLPVFVGGNTLWIDWLVNGIPDAPPMNPAIRQQAVTSLAAYKRAGDWNGGVDYVLQYSSVKPKKLPRNDWYRLERCLEIGLSGEIVPSHLTLTPDRYFDTVTGCRARSTTTSPRTPSLLPLDMRCLFLMDDRHIAYQLIDKRCEAMVQAGIFEEVANLLISGRMTPSSMVARAVGYKETIEYLLRPDYQHNDRAAFETFILNFTSASRNYARRQYQWFGKSNAFLWLHSQRQQYPNHIHHLVEEAKHWICIERDQYDKLLDMQIAQAKDLQHSKFKSPSECVNLPSQFSKVYTGQNYFYRAHRGANPKVDMRTYIPCIHGLNEGRTLSTMIRFADAARNRIKLEAPHLIENHLS